MPERLSLSELDARDADSPMRHWDEDKTPERLRYAWNWFSYHANQRLAAFNYFLVIVAVLTTGYLTCIDRLLYAMQTILGLVGIMISIAFLALDFRNEQLVDHSRAALRSLERAIDTTIHRLDYDLEEKRISLLQLLFGLAASPARHRWSGRMRLSVQHSVWLRRIERVAMVLFLAATIHGAYLMIATRSLYGIPAQQSSVEPNLQLR
jgi:hypothetical protein